MSKSIHDILYQGNICMLRIDTDIQLVGIDTQNHAGKGNQWKLANRRKVTLCCWLWEVISKMLQRCTVQSRKAQKGSHYAFLPACAHGRMCVLPCARMGVCLCLFPVQGTKEQNKPEVAWQQKTLPNVNFEDVGTAGGGERKKRERERDRNGKQKKGCCDCNALLTILGRGCIRNLYYMTQNALWVHLFIYGGTCLYVKDNVCQREWTWKKQRLTGHLFSTDVCERQSAKKNHWGTSGNATQNNAALQAAYQNLEQRRCFFLWKYNMLIRFFFTYSSTQWLDCRLISETLSIQAYML